MSPHAHLEYAGACVICGTPLAGAFSLGFRIVGIRRSSRNPNLCSRCNTHAEEGRVVELTVLFADISSFTEMTHELGPERTHEVVDAFLQMATQALVEYDAFIDKYVGDAVMAFFNAPIRRADHAACAVGATEAILAGLPPLRERFGRALNISVGIASGWARVGRLGSQDGRDYTAIGDVVNLAARLQGAARAGEILVDQGVYDSVVERYPHVEEESLSLKGFGEPTAGYRLNAAEGAPPAPPSDAGGRRVLSLGSAIFAVLGAPCAAATLIGPLAVSLGLGASVGASSALWALGDAPIRYPILALATLGALANLYTLWHARRLRQEFQRRGTALSMTRHEWRQTILLIGTSILTLAIVVFELYSPARLVG
jgi:adenylate cyclase